MIDRLTKKRAKVDYLKIIRLLGLSGKFISYVEKKQSNISTRRQALCFLRQENVDLYACYIFMKHYPEINTYDELFIAQNGHLEDFYEL